RPKIRRALQRYFRPRPAPLLIFQALRLQPNRFVESRHKAVRIRPPEKCRPLMPDQPVTIHQKLVAFRLASEDGMIVNYKARLTFPSFALKNQPRRQPADASANNHAIV